MDKSQRKEHFINYSTDLQVGPGAYNSPWKTGPMPVTMNKAGKSNVNSHRFGTHIVKKRKNRGSIKADFEESDDDSDDVAVSPGPGKYLNS